MSRPVLVALHGVGSTDVQISSALKPLEEVADVLVLPGPDPFDGGGAGRQWFSIAGVTEENRPARAAAALEQLLPRLDQLAGARGMLRDELVLLGFSQGAILTLGAVASGAHRGAAVAIAGRLATPIVPAEDRPGNVLLVHDRNDPVMPVQLAAAAAEELARAGHDVDRVLTTGIGHSIGPATLTAVYDWLGSLPPRHQLSARQKTGSTG